LDVYLDIATTILRAEKRPLSSRAILAEAHRIGLVPPNLYGKAQHKTLHARLSEDIVNNREHSRFFRTAPGRFFLREFMDDASLPEDQRQPFPARRRIRDLARGPALAISSALLRRIVRTDKPITTAKILSLLRKDNYSYLNPKKKPPNAVFVWSFVCVCRGSEILTYRLGRYREDRDSFLHKRSIGFSTLVHIDEHTLFNVDDLGIVEAGLRATKIDLDIPASPPEAVHDLDKAALHKFLWVNREADAGDLLAVVSYRCPTWFEPIKRRLALNDLRWIDASGVNDIDDFDPWSRSVLEAHRISKTLFGAQLD
jgi:hypothetical protein